LKTIGVSKMGEIERLRILKEMVLGPIEDEKLSEIVSKVCELFDKTIEEF
jgi:hypothetical protein